jgi:AraC-like DNA-binding protein
VADERALIENMLQHPSLYTSESCGCRQQIDLLCAGIRKACGGEMIKLRHYIANFFICAAQAFSPVPLDTDFKEYLGSVGATNKAVRIANYIKQNCSQDISVQSTSQALNYSTRHIQRVITDYYGISFSEMLTQYRLGRAMFLLCNTGDALEIIGEKSGFRDAKGLYRNFKEYLSMTPSDFRKETQAVSAESPPASENVQLNKRTDSIES